MDMPSSVGVGYIEGRWIAAGLDNLDVGLRPQAVQIDSLRVSIVPTSPQIRLTLPVGPTMIHLPEIVLVTNQAGEVVNPKTGESTVAVIATDNPNADFRYLITVTADGMAPVRAQIEVPSNQTVDLADLGAWPVPLPEETAAWEAALSTFQVYRDQVVAASDAITLALDGADLAVVASWAVDTQTARDQTLAAKAAVDQSIAGLDIPTLEGLRDDIAGSVSANATHVADAELAEAGAVAAQAAAEVARDEAVQAAGGGVIDDGSTVADFTWSSQKISDGLALKSNHGHQHVTADVTGLDTALAGKADAAATSAALSGKADTLHGHAVADVTGLQAALDGKAGTTHSHEIAEVNGLSLALGGKSDANHTHVPAHITGFAQAVKDALGFRVWSTTLTIPVDAAVSGTAEVTFPAGTFTDTPNVVATRSTSTSAYWMPYIAGRSSASTTVGIFNTQNVATTVSIQVQVVAVQML